MSGADSIIDTIGQIQREKGELLDTWGAVRAATDRGSREGTAVFDYFSKRWSLDSEYPGEPIRVPGRVFDQAVFTEGHYDHVQERLFWRVLAVDGETGQVWSPVRRVNGLPVACRDQGRTRDAAVAVARMMEESE